MTNSMTTVKLSGKLGQRFGREHRFALDTHTVAEAVSALRSQLMGFGAELLGSKDRGITYAVFIDKRNIGADDLTTPVPEGATIRIAPILMGSKSGGVLTTILGVVLIVVGVIGETYGQAFGGGAWGPVAMKLGVALVAGGIVQMLSPQPKGIKNGDGPNNDPSYSFAGPVNTEAQGHPVPIVYGRGIVGSAVVSAGIVAEDYVQHGGVGVGTPNWKPKTPFEIPA